MNVNRLKSEQKNLAKIFSVLAFKLLWVGLVIYQNAFIWIALILIALMLVINLNTSRDLFIVLGIWLLGMVTDQALLSLNILEFGSTYLPIWLAILWLAFSATLYSIHQFFQPMTPGMKMLIGACGGALSYYAGYLLGSVEFTYSVLSSILVIGLSWLALFPLFLVILSRPTYTFNKHYFKSFRSFDV